MIRMMRRYVKVSLFVCGVLFLYMWSINFKFEESLRDDMELALRLQKRLMKDATLGSQGKGKFQPLHEPKIDEDDSLLKFAPNAPIDMDGVMKEQPEVDQHEVPFPKIEAPVVQIPLPVQREGLGEQGRAVNVDVSKLSHDEKEEYDAGFINHAFNIYASDRISLDRSLPDVRNRDCPAQKYRPERELPSASVIIIFHNEAWSILLRTVHSVINRSPPGLLHEVILVDDYSDLPHLQEPLDKYISRWDNVHLLRSEKRMGLVHARLMGTEYATGDVLIYLDSHCECSAGWLVPLLDRIVDDERCAVMPVIDIISDETMEYQPRDIPDVGGFTWGLGFTWHQIPKWVKKGLKSIADPVPTPTMPGGLFAISKAYFQHIGMYDKNLEIWGGENLEISFKIWMCGGRMEFIPCSHVGHIFRKRSPYKWESKTVEVANIMKYNLERVAEVWLDEYKQFYYDTFNNEKIDPGDLTEQKAIRERLQCKSFDWYIKNIYPEMFIPSEALQEGEVRNGDTCADATVDAGGTVGTFPCHGGGGNQMWFFSKINEIRRDDVCWDYNGQGDEVILHACHGIPKNQIWTYREDKHLYHDMSDKCAELSEDGKQISMQPCSTNQRQVWQWNKTVKRA